MDWLCVEGSVGVCGIDGVYQQMSGGMETCVEFSMAPQNVAAEHCKDYDVAGLPLEFECLDDGQGTKRQNCELERENVGECCWSEKTARNGAGTVVETLAQDWSSMDREMQYECAGGHQRTYAQLGRPCGQDGLQRNLREGSDMPRPSMVEMETISLERGGERQWAGPHPDGLSGTVQDNTGWLLFAQNRRNWKQFSKYGKSPEKMAPGASGTQARPARLGQMQVLLCWQREDMGESGLACTWYTSLCIKPSVTLL